MNDELIYCEYCDSEKPTNAFRPSDLKRATQKCSDCANRQKREYRSDPTYKRWALNNLRPYSAKQNNLDGVKRTRHKKKDTK